MTEVPANMPERMIAYRARWNIGQRELARRCNVTTQTIGNIENRRRTGITKLTKAKIERVIGSEEDESQ